MGKYEVSHATGIVFASHALGSAEFRAAFAPLCKHEASFSTFYVDAPHRTSDVVTMPVVTAYHSTCTDQSYVTLEKGTPAGICVS